MKRCRIQSAINAVITKISELSFPRAKRAGNLSQDKKRFGTSRNDRLPGAGSFVREHNSKFEVQAWRPLFLLLALLFFAVTLCASCARHKERIFKKTAILMDTLVSISVVSESGERAEKAMDAAFAEIGRLDGMLNFFSDKSELSKINANAGIGAIKVSPQTIEIFTRAVSTSEKTGGAFDVTIGPEITLWDFVAKKGPDDRGIRERLNLVDYRQIAIDRERSTVYLSKRGMLADLGAIAKGYAADKAVDELKKQGVKAGLVAVAGDIRAFGLKPDGSGWRVGIRNPRFTSKDDEIMATIELRDRAISTSGDYERYFVRDGKRYHHILDPKTGYPADGCQSVTVIAKEGVDTDSFSTGVFVLGPEKGVRLLKEMGFEGLIVDKDGKIHTTPGLEGSIEFQRNR